MVRSRILSEESNEGSDRSNKWRQAGDSRRLMGRFALCLAGHCAFFGGARLRGSYDRIPLRDGQHEIVSPVLTITGVYSDSYHGSPSSRFRITAAALSPEIS